MERETNMNYVIIGNGAAGIHAAETIRQFDSKGKITDLRRDLPAILPSHDQHGAGGGRPT